MRPHGRWGRTRHAQSAGWSPRRFFASSTRREDAPGAVVEEIDELEELPAIETTLAAADGAAGEVLPVHLRSHVTEVGTLELQLVSQGGRAWKLEFSVRQE